MRRATRYELGLAVVSLLACFDAACGGGDDDGEADGDADADSDGDGIGDAGVCEDDCSHAGGTRCHGDAVENCTEVADGCLHWVTSEDCAELGQSCEDAAGGPACTCVLCPTVGATRCNGNVIESCTQDVNGCRRWAAEEDCSDSDLACRRVTGEVVCIACDGGLWDGDYTISNADTLAGLAGYSGVSGSLYVGDLLVARVALPTLHGLECLQEVGWSVYLRGEVDSVTSLDGLNNLTSIGHDLIVSGNDTLTNLNGLDGLTSIGGGLHLGNVPRCNSCMGGYPRGTALTSLDGLRGLTSIGADLNLVRNDFLASLVGLGGLTSIGGDLGISGNRSLPNLDGLGALRSIGGSLALTGVATSTLGRSLNSGLVDLDGLGGLTELGGDLLATDNPALPTCEATLLADRLASLGWDGTVTIEGNDDAGLCE